MIDKVSSVLTLLEKIIGLKTHYNEKAKFKLMVHSIFIDVETIVNDYLSLLGEALNGIKNSNYSAEYLNNLQDRLLSRRFDYYSLREKIRGYLLTDYYKEAGIITEFVNGIMQIMYAGIDCSNPENNYDDNIYLPYKQGHTIISLLEHLKHRLGREELYIICRQEKHIIKPKEYTFMHNYQEDLECILECYINQIIKGWNLVCKSYALLLVNNNDYNL